MTENLDVKNLEVENPRVAPATSRTGSDTIDAILEVWARELPELDLDTEGIVERIQWLEHHVLLSIKYLWIELLRMKVHNGKP